MYNAISFAIEADNTDSSIWLISKINATNSEMKF